MLTPGKEDPMREILRISTVFTLLLPALAFAQGQLVKVVVPYAPGGNIDVTARIYAQKVEELLKEKWIIENLSGGNGTIGTHAVAKSAPDGKTLLFTADVHSMARLVIKNVPYDPLTDFVAIARVAEIPLIFIANPAQISARDLAGDLSSALDKNKLFGENVKTAFRISDSAAAEVRSLHRRAGRGKRPA